MSPAPKRLSRRTLLRGASGVALALPFLDAMRPRAARAQAAMTPRRIIFAFQANGDEIATRFTTVGETNFVFGEFLAPLEPYRQDLLILHKLDKKFGKLPAGSVADNHEQGGSSLAPWPSGTGSYPIGGADTTIGFVMGPSADRSIGDMVLADEPEHPVPAPRLPGGRQAERHLEPAFARRARWGRRTRSRPRRIRTPPTRASSCSTRRTRPRRRRSRSGCSRSSRRSTSCSPRRTRSRRKVGAKDKEKLDLHMTSLRDIERTLQGTTGTAVPAMGCKPADLGTAVDPYNDANHMVIGELFFKISALAFACDLTRVIQYNWSGNTSNRIYANLGMTEGHHDISHQNTTDAFAKIRTIHKHLWTQNLKLYEALKAMPDGDGTLWDKTLVVHWNELAQGDTHAINNNLVIFAGKADNAFRRGRYIDFANKQSFSDMLDHLPPVHGLLGRHVVRRLAARGDGAAARADLIPRARVRLAPSGIVGACQTCA